MTPFPVVHGSPERIASFRSVLSSVGFEPGKVLETIGVTDPASVTQSDMLLLMHRTAAGTPLDILIRLFLIEAPVEKSALARAVAPMTPAEWEEMGLITIRNGKAAANLKLMPCEDMVLVCDLPRRLLDPAGSDYVMGIAGSSLTLANLTIRKPCARALDLGTGCGFQAFLLAKHCGAVTAVDCNPRAVAIANFNAKLNGLSTVDFREGFLFEPVDEMSFDLIVYNSPFVISPEFRYAFRDGGMPCDEMWRMIVREAPRHMAEGGFCQFLCNWAEYKDQDWRERIREWFDGSGCDVLVMRSASSDVATYAATWLRQTEKLKFEDLSGRFDEWMEYYRKEEMERVGGGVVNMRRSDSGDNWFHVDDGIETICGPGGEYVLKVFAAHDFLHKVRDDSQLLEIPFTVSPGLRIVQQKQPSPGGWAIETSEVHLARGVFQKGGIDPYVERLLIRCDGSKPLMALVQEMASALGIDVDRVVPTTCRLVRDFVRRTFLLPP